MAVLFVGSIVEGCILRDPWVELGNGYNIGAISWGSPCHLTYYESQDHRPRSPWTVVDVTDGFVLYNPEPQEWREYKTREELQEAAREMRARPSAGRMLLDGVTGFNANERFAIGRSADSYFVLNLTDDSLETWPTYDAWSGVVRTRTGLDPEQLRDPKSWWLQYRRSGYWAVMGTWGGGGAVWSAVPLLRRRSATHTIASCGAGSRDLGDR
jgi:hypothetical protein